MNKLHQYINVREYAFEASSLEDKNVFKGLSCYMLDFHSWEPSGTDCVVVYFANSREEMLSRMKANDPLFDESMLDSLVDMDGYDDFDPEFIQELRKIKFCLVLPEEKSQLKPINKEGAEALMKYALKSYTETLFGETPENKEWYVFENTPYRMEKLGHVTLNCLQLLNL